MIALLLPWLKAPSLYAVLAIIVLCIVIFNAGARHNESKHEKATADTNKVIVEDRGKDEAEISANKEAAETVDAAVKAKLKQTLILDGETAQWLGLVK